MKVVAVSADRPARLVESRRKHDLGYLLLSDASMQASRAYGIAWQVDAAGVDRYARYGIDLEDASGEAHHQLPVPSVFLVDAAGRVRWRFSNPDYKVRPDNDELLAAAREVAGSADSGE